jgi:EAL domain-containing protein (putative c-di-GMP-specific phosphodiesterase class I)
VVHLATGRPVGAEALLRWRHPTLGLVSPGEFVPVAEDLGLLHEIADWVLHRACRQLSIWTNDGRDLWVSINVTAGQLTAPAFVGAVTVAVNAHQIPTSELVIEITEAGLTGAATPANADDAAQAVVAHLAELRAMGVRIAVDHFGAAATSLSQLRMLPVDLLKVDREVFAEPAGQTGPVPAIIEVIVKLGAQIGVEVAAQRLESAADLDVARTAGCGYGQGYLFSHPLPPEHLEAFFDGHRAHRS